VAIVVPGAALVHVSPVTGNVPFTASVSCAAAATSVVHDDVGGCVIVCAYESPIATNTCIGAYVSLATTVSSVVHDDVGGGVVVVACAVTECVGTGVTGVAWVHESPVDADMPSAASLAFAAAVWLVVNGDVCGGVGVGSCAHKCPVATNASSSASLSVAAALLAVVDDDVGGDVAVAANDVIKCVAIIVTSAAFVHVSPVIDIVPCTESVSLTAAAT